MNSKDLKQLIFSPFHSKNILLHFFSGANTVHTNGIKIELINIVLPIIYNENVCNSLMNLNKNSRFTNLLQTYEFQIFYPQINNLIKEHKKNTSQALILLNNDYDLVISEFVILKSKADYRTEEDIILKSIYRSAYNLGILIAKERYTTCFLKLKITEL